MTPSAALLAHEWAKHGSCMVRTPASYFKVTRILWNSLRWPDFDRISRTEDLTAGQVRRAFADANRYWEPEHVGIVVNERGWLTELRLCYGRDFMPARGEEFAQQRRRRFLADSGVDLGPMQALRLLEHTRPLLDRAALGIGRAVVEPGDPSMPDRSGAHRAWLERDPQLAAVEPLVAEPFGGAAQGEDLGMGGRVGEPARRVVRLADHRAVLDHDRADRHFARRRCGPRQLERARHRFGKRPAGHSRGARAHDRLTQGGLAAMRAAFRDTPAQDFSRDEPCRASAN